MSFTQRRLRSPNPVMCPLLFIVLVFAPMVLVGCQSPGQALRSAIYSTPTPHPTRRPTVEVDVCKLISLNEVESIVGVPLEYNTPLIKYPSGGTLRCAFLISTAKSDPTTVKIDIDQRFTITKPDYVKTIFATLHIADTEVNGIGDRAYISHVITETNTIGQQSLYVLQQDIELSTTIKGAMSDQQREDWLKAITQIALSRLPVTVVAPISATATPKP